MWAYALRRLLLIVPTLFGILLINFVVIQFAPGGPVEQILAQIKGTAVDPAGRMTGNVGSEASSGTRAPRSAGQLSGEATSKYRGARGLDPALIKDLEKQFGFDQPLHVRFGKMLWDYLRFDFGNSFFRDRNVLQLVREKLPVSISLGLWSALLVYLISIPLGVAKAVRDGSRFDLWTSTVVIIANAIPGFLFAILLIVVFAGGRYFSWFPLRGLVSENWHSLGLCARVTDYLWHMILPVTAITLGGFATLTMWTKNSFLDQIHQQYVLTAYAKGLSDRQVLYGHVFRNAMLIIIAGFPAELVRMLFTGSLLVEVIFSLDGLGLLGFEAAMKRDYPIMFASLYISTLMGLLLTLISDLTYTVVDPRIDFEAR
jgi:microcin C transport system permease protein